MTSFGAFKCIYEINSILEMPAAYKERLVHLVYILLSIWQIEPMQQSAGISCLMSFRRFWMLAVKAVSKDGLLGVRERFQGPD